MKIKRGKYPPLTRKVAMLQKELTSVAKRLKNILEAINTIENDATALWNSTAAHAQRKEMIDRAAQWEVEE